MCDSPPLTQKWGVTLTQNNSLLSNTNTMHYKTMTLLCASTMSHLHPRCSSSPLAFTNIVGLGLKVLVATFGLAICSNWFVMTACGGACGGGRGLLWWWWLRWLRWFAVASSTCYLCIPTPLAQDFVTCLSPRFVWKHQEFVTGLCDKDFVTGLCQDCFTCLCQGLVRQDFVTGMRYWILWLDCLDLLAAMCDSIALQYCVACLVLCKVTSFHVGSCFKPQTCFWSRLHPRLTFPCSHTAFFLAKHALDSDPFCISGHTPRSFHALSAWDLHWHFQLCFADAHLRHLYSLVFHLYAPSFTACHQRRDLVLNLFPYKVLSSLPITKSLPTFAHSYAHLIPSLQCTTSQMQRRQPLHGCALRSTTLLVPAPVSTILSMRWSAY